MMEHQELWDLRLVSWEDFSTAVIQMEGPVWNFFSQADLLIGGVDFSDNFL
jgi:hypothetical protein